MGGDNTQLREAGQNDEKISESVGDIPDVSTLGTGFRADNDNLHQSQNFLDGNGIINPGDSQNESPCDWSDDANLIPSGNNNTVSVESHGGTSPLAGSMMIVNAALGAGLLNFPAAFHEAGGVIAANIVQLVSVFGNVIPKIIYS